MFGPSFGHGPGTKRAWRVPSEPQRPPDVREHETGTTVAARSRRPRTHEIRVWHDLRRDQTDLCPDTRDMAEPFEAERHRRCPAGAEQHFRGSVLGEPQVVCKPSAFWKEPQPRCERRCRGEP